MTNNEYIKRIKPYMEIYKQSEKIDNGIYVADLYLPIVKINA